MSKIEWTEKTWNPIVGCSIVSPGCTNCYAMKMAARLERMGGADHYGGTTKMVNGNAVWTGKMAMAPDHILTAPLRVKKPTMWFVNSMSDLFHEDVPDEWIDRVFAVMALCPQHTFQVLTKRSKRMREYMEILTRDTENWKTLTTSALQPPWARGFGGMTNWNRDDPRAENGLRNIDPSEGMWPPKNIWLGVSAEDQTRANERIPDLLATPAAVRFVSAEPLLSAIDFRIYMHDSHCIESGQFLTDCICGDPREVSLDQIIVGGESGPAARPMHPDWARSIRDQCHAAGVAYFFKQHGEHIDADQWLKSLKVGTPLKNGRTLFEPLNFADADALAGMCGIKKFTHESDGRTTFHVGKARAGRLLDGQ